MRSRPENGAFRNGVARSAASVADGDPLVAVGRVADVVVGVSEGQPARVESTPNGPDIAEEAIFDGVAESIATGFVR